MVATGRSGPWRKLMYKINRYLLTADLPRAGGGGVMSTKAAKSKAAPKRTRTVPAKPKSVFIGPG